MRAFFRDLLAYYDLAEPAKKTPGLTESECRDNLKPITSGVRLISTQKQPEQRETFLRGSPRIKLPIKFDK